MKLINLNASNLQDIEEFRRIVSILLENVVSILNNGILFSDNFSSKIQSVEFGAANTEVQVQHNLNRIPTGYLVLKLSAAAIIYDGTTSNTNTNAFLRASAPCTATIMLF